MRVRRDMFAAMLLVIGCDGAQKPVESAPRSEAPRAVEIPASSLPTGDGSEPVIATAQPQATAALVAPVVAAPVEAAPQTMARPPLSPEAAKLFSATIREVVRMTRDRPLQRKARAHKMRLVNLTWEDTGRWLGSSVGPNISDLTLEVIERRPKRRPRTHLLPVLRYPNFSDRTADVPADRFFVYTGNQTAGAPRETVSLAQLLAHVSAYLSTPEGFRGRKDDLTAARDTHYLVSAQHVFVPVPDGVQVEFAPVLFNYQSDPGSPAVLCILATREGTSIQVIENRPDASHPYGWGQRLYFNRAGQRSTFTAERRSDVAERIERGEARPEDATALEKGADMVMIIQIPLVLPRGARGGGFGGLGWLDAIPAGVPNGSGGSDVEAAVVGHGLDEGPFIETRRQQIRRDRRFPIRVTIQFYRATSNGVVSEADLDEAAAQIERVYNDADFVGSLVVGSQDRPTASAGAVTPG